MFYEPQETQYDLKFNLLGISVRIHPMFWLLSLLLGWNSPNAQILFLWILAVTVSILVHELGHALAMRLYGLQPRIVLYSFGGLTIYDRMYHLRWFENIFISFAGPGAGFLFLGIITGCCVLSGNPQILGYFPLVLGVGGEFMPVGGLFSTFLLLFLVEVNLLWGILNLMPIFPLDGGQIVREYCTNLSPAQGLYHSIKISFVTAIILIVVFFFAKQYFLALMFVWMAHSNYQILQQMSRRRW